MPRNEFVNVCNKIAAQYSKLGDWSLASSVQTIFRSRDRRERIRTGAIMLTPIVPRAVCYFVNQDLFFVFTIITNGLETDSGAALEKQEGGCGALTKWNAADIDVAEDDG